MLNSDTWFSGWDKLGTIAVTALTFYIYVVALVRIFGKRTTNQLNNCDWIITFAIGSIVASGILLEEVTVLDSALAILILAILQWLTTWTVLRSRFASKMVKSDPTLLLHKGRFIESAMNHTRVSEEEIRAVLRSKGMFSVDEANWVILETNGTFSVMPHDKVTLNKSETMVDVKRPSGAPYSSA